MKPQYSQTFVITSNTGYDSEFREDYEEDVGVSVVDTHAQNKPDDIADNNIPPLSESKMNGLHYTTTHVYQVLHYSLRSRANTHYCLSSLLLLLETETSFIKF